MSPTVIAYNEVYNAIQNNVISGRRERGGRRRAMKFYEVAPNLR
jgi:TRAP-type C4-dicarboxylate transport system substrate-binding protein